MYHGYWADMDGPQIRTQPRRGEVWLSCPPYLLLAQIVEVSGSSDPPVLSYELHDENGSVLERVDHAALDRGWWRSFQPLVRRNG